jgi:hypothetical protein
LEDWVLPIVYQNQEVRFAVQPMMPKEETEFYQRQVERYRGPEPGYAFFSFEGVWEGRCEMVREWVRDLAPAATYCRFLQNLQVLRY